MTLNTSETKVKCREFIYIGLSIPVSMVIFVIGKIYSRATNHNGIFSAFIRTGTNRDRIFNFRVHADTMEVISVLSVPVHHVRLRLQAEVGQPIRCHLWNNRCDHSHHRVASLPCHLSGLLLQQLKGHKISTRREEED